MNTATVSHRIPTLTALSIALLISGTTHASHRADSSQTLHPQDVENATSNRADCGTGISGPIADTPNSRSAVPACADDGRAGTATPAPIRLAKPLLGNPYRRSGEGIRYTF